MAQLLNDAIEAITQTEPLAMSWIYTQFDCGKF